MKNLGDLGEILGQRPDIARRLERLEGLREIEDRFSGRSIRVLVLDSGSASTSGAVFRGNVSATDREPTQER